MIKTDKVRLELGDLWNPVLLVTKIVDACHILLKLLCCVSINYQKVVHWTATYAQMLDAKLMAFGGLGDHLGPLFLLGEGLADLGGWSALIGWQSVHLAHGHREVAEVSAILTLVGILINVLSIHHVRDVF